MVLLEGRPDGLEPALLRARRRSRRRVSSRQAPKPSTARHVHRAVSKSAARPRWSRGHAEEAPSGEHDPLRGVARRRPTPTATPELATSPRLHVRERVADCSPRRRYHIARRLSEVASRVAEPCHRPLAALFIRRLRAPNRRRGRSLRARDPAEMRAGGRQGPSRRASPSAIMLSAAAAREKVSAVGGFLRRLWHFGFGVFERATLKRGRLPRYSYDDRVRASEAETRSVEPWGRDRDTDHGETEDDEPGSTPVVAQALLVRYRHALATFGVSSCEEPARSRGSRRCRSPPRCVSRSRSPRPRHRAGARRTRVSGCFPRLQAGVGGLGRGARRDAKAPGGRAVRARTSGRVGATPSRRACGIARCGARRNPRRCARRRARARTFRTLPPPSLAAAIPANELPKRGEMVRYWITVTERGGERASARKPKREGDVYGAVVDAAAIANETPRFPRSTGSWKTPRARGGTTRWRASWRSTRAAAAEDGARAQVLREGRDGARRGSPARRPEHVGQGRLEGLAQAQVQV